MNRGGSVVCDPDEKSGKRWAEPTLSVGLKRVRQPPR